MIKGIDVSSHNAGFNYASAKAQGFEYCYIKATEGKSYINPEMDAQYTMAKKNGFKVGFYHYCNDNSSAEIQADFFNSVIKKYDQDLMPCLDIETNMSNPTDFTERFIQRLGGKDRAIIYTGLYYYRQYINTNGYKIWVAAYGQSKPSMRDNNMVGWQYTDSGINGRTDLSEWYGDILIKKETPTDQRTETDTISNGIVTASVLNVRDGAGMNYPVIGQLTKGTNVRIGAQNVHFEEKGAFTGEVSPKMLQDIGVEYVIIGHSERREYYNETDESVNKKIKAAFSHNLKPIVCVGETLSQREAGVTKDFVTTQTRLALEGLTEEQVKNTIIAYEPIWAIGTGKTASKEDANEVCSWIREEIRSLYADIADEIIIQYGGSVKSSNAKELFSMPDIDGGLVGGASLDAEDFSKIVNYTK